MPSLMCVVIKMDAVALFVHQSDADPESVKKHHEHLLIEP